jgi:hypothetical protein
VRPDLKDNYIKQRRSHTHLLVLLFFISVFGGCASWKDTLIANGNQNDAIKNAITDFLHHKSYIKRDSIFTVRIDYNNSEILEISISAEKNKIAVINENEVEYSYRAFPTNFLEKDGLLFYWHDSTKLQSTELINKLTKLKLIDTAIFGKYIPTRYRDDSQKAVDYFFCKSDLKNYKKVYTSIAVGWYDPPILNCRPN